MADNNSQKRDWRFIALRIGASILMLAAAATLDWVSGPELDLYVLYLLPIIYSATALGRRTALAVAFASEVPTYFDEMRLVAAGERAEYAVVTLVVRLCIFVLAAEAAYRLARSQSNLRSANREVRGALDRLDDDVEAAGALQRAALGFASPQVPGYELGREVRWAGPTGGDFAYAGFVDGHVFACVADIAGKGTPAALFTGLLKYLLQAAHERGLRGTEAIKALNVSLSQQLPEDRFVTLVYLEVDPACGRVVCVNAGHPEALIFRARTGEVEPVPGTAPLLGIAALDSGFGSREFTLEDGDSVVVYTDGATDSRDLSGNRIGDGLIRRLVSENAHLPAQAAARRICDEIEAQTEEEARDDLTILCLKRTASTDARL